MFIIVAASAGVALVIETLLILAAFFVCKILSFQNYLILAIFSIRAVLTVRWECAEGDKLVNVSVL